MTATVMQANMTTYRAKKAERIRELMQRWADNGIKLGIELREARETFEIGPRGLRIGWEKWLKSEIGFRSRYANSFIQVADKFGDLGPHVAGVSFRVLRFLARESTPEEAKKEVLRRAQGGEKIGHVKAKRIADTHRPPPKQANEIARETGKPTLASDGFVYLGGTKEEVKESTERRTLVYAVRRAINTLSSVEVSPNQFLETALPHQLWTKREERQIDDALRWLTALKAAWSVRK
jgi:hypothetical protein